MQENIEGDFLFSLLRLKPADVPSPFRHPRFRGNDGKWDCVETRIPRNSFETIPPAFSQFIPDFCKRLI